MNARKVFEINENLTGMKSEVLDNYALFNQFKLRQEFENSCHSDTKTIVLRIGKSLRPDTPIDAIDEYIMYHELECEWWWNNLGFFPTIHKTIHLFMNRLDLKELGWVTVVALKPGGLIKPHPDEGAYCEYYNRYHIPLFTENAPFFVDDEEYQFKEGELWTFDNQLTHWTINESDKERIHLIFDAK